MLVTWEPHADLVSNSYMGDLNCGPSPWVPTHMTLRKVPALVTSAEIEKWKKQTLMVADGLVATVAEQQKC